MVLGLPGVTVASLGWGGCMLQLRGFFQAQKHCTKNPKLQNGKQPLDCTVLGKPSAMQGWSKKAKWQGWSKKAKWQR